MGASHRSSSRKWNILEYGKHTYLYKVLPQFVSVQLVNISPITRVKMEAIPIVFMGIIT